MGNLNNLYISQSFQSLAHLGTDTSLVPGTMTELQDGIGQSLNIFFDGTNISSSGNIYGANITASAVNTGSLVTTSSFNAYTSSTNVRLNNLESTSASVNISITNLNASSASQQVSINNLNAKTGSYATTGSNTFTGINNFSASVEIVGGLNLYNNGMTLGLPKNMGDPYENIGIQTAFVYGQSASGNELLLTGDQMLNRGVRITNGLSVTGSLRVTQALTASAARIANLNYPTTDGTFTGQVLQTNAAGTLSFGNVNAVFENIRNGELTTITKGTPLYVSGAQGDTPIVYRADATNPSKMPVTFVAMENIASNATGRGITLGLITGIDMTGYTEGTQLWVDGLGLLTNVRPTGSADIVQPIGIVTKTGNGGQLNILNPGPVLLPNIQTGYVWVGDATNYPVAVATSSLVTNINTGSLLTTSSFNQYTASNNQRVSSLEVFSASALTSISNLNSATSSYVTETESGSFMITGSIAGNILTFTKGDASQFSLTIPSATGSIFNTGSFATTGSNTFTGNQTISKNGGQFEVVDPTNPQFGTSSFGISGASGGLTFKSSGSIVIEGSAGTKNLTFYGTGSFVRGIKISDDDFTNGADLIYNTTTDVLSISRAGAGSASLNIEGTFTSSLEQGYVWVGGNNNRTITVATSSFGGGGSINTGSFATTGSNTFNGNQTIIGSVSISSSAATDLAITGAAKVVSQNGLQVNTIAPNTFNIGTTQDPNVNAEAYMFGSTASVSSIYVGVFDDPNFNTDVELKLSAASTGLSFNDWDNGSTFAYVPWLEIEPNLGNNPAPQFKRSIAVTGSVAITEVLNLKAQNPLPAGNIGDLAVSGSNLYFYNGAWTLVI